MINNSIEKYIKLSRIIITFLVFVVLNSWFLYENDPQWIFSIIITGIVFFINIPSSKICKFLIGKGDKIKNIILKALYYFLALPIAFLILLIIVGLICAFFVYLLELTDSLDLGLAVIIAFVGIGIFTCLLVPYFQTLIILILRWIKKGEIYHMDSIENLEIKNLNNEDKIEINLFGKKKLVTVFSTGDNQFDENGNYKESNFKLSQEELDVLNWFINNIKIEDYKKEIMDYCNREYSSWQDNDGIQETLIGIDDVESEINIDSIAVNVTKTWQANDGTIYPEISFYGGCNCDEEHGICIGFRDKKFIGINNQDWTL